MNNEATLAAPTETVIGHWATRGKATQVMVVKVVHPGQTIGYMVSVTGGCGWMDFASDDDAIAWGEAAVERCAPKKLKRLV